MSASIGKESVMLLFDVIIPVPHCRVDKKGGTRPIKIVILSINLGIMRIRKYSYMS